MMMFSPLDGGDVDYDTVAISHDGFWHWWR